MSRIKGTKSSAALIVALVALVAALGGGAVAGVAVTSLSKKDKKQVKKIARKQIEKREPKLNVKSAKSVNGQTIVPINHRSNDTVNAKLVSLNGVTIRVSCAGGTESITVTTTTPDGEISAISNDASTATGDGGSPVGSFADTFDPGDTFEAAPGIGQKGVAASERQYTITYSGSDDKNVTATFVTEDDVGDSDCVVGGYAIG